MKVSILLQLLIEAANKHSVVIKLNIWAETESIIGVAATTINYWYDSQD